MKKLRVLLLVAVLVFSLAVPCFAADDGSPIVFDGVSYPVYTSNHGNIVDWVSQDENRQAIIYTYGSATRLMLTETKIGPSGASICAVQSSFVSGAKSYRYTLVDGAWVYNESKSLVSGGSVGSVDAVIVSSRTYGGNSWYPRVEQHIRFRGALPVMILEVAEEQLTVTLPDLGGTMKVLALCGVGCLALLMVFKLLDKGFLTFLR